MFHLSFPPEFCVCRDQAFLFAFFHSVLARVCLYANLSSSWCGWFLDLKPLFFAPLLWSWRMMTGFLFVWWPRFLHPEDLQSIRGWPSHSRWCVRCWLVVARRCWLDGFYFWIVLKVILGGSSLPMWEYTLLALGQYSLASDQPRISMCTPGAFTSFQQK